MMSRERILVAVFMLVLLGTAGVFVFEKPDDATTIILVRHAERTDDSANTNLSEAGLVRAEQLLAIVESKDVAGIYSTNFCRTAQTIQPAALHFSLPIQLQVIPSSSGLTNCEPAITALLEYIPDNIEGDRAFLDYVVEENKGSAVIIAGHSNTVPRMVAELGGGEPVHIGHDDYEDVFIVSMPAGSGAVRLEHTSYKLMLEDITEH